MNIIITEKAKNILIKLYSNNGGSTYIAVCGNIIIGNSSDVINECNRQK